MDYIIEQKEKMLGECTRRANNLYKKLSMEEDNAILEIEHLNYQKIRIIIAKIMLFIKKVQRFFGNK